MIPTPVLRVRHALATASRWTVALFLVLGMVLAGVGLWTYAHPPTTDVVDRENEQTVRSTLNVSANVTGNSSMFERGTRVSGLPVYFRSSMPRATLVRQTSVPADRPVEVTHELSLVYRVTREDELIWRDRTVLVADATTTESGSVVVRTPLDVREVTQRRREIRSEVGSAGTVSVVLRTNVTYRTGTYEGRLTDTTDVVLGSDWYDVPPTTAERTHARRVERTVAVGHQSPWPYAVPAGLGVGLVLVGVATLVFRRRGSPAATAREIHRRRHEEWISEGRLPPRPAGVVTVETLDDLVDVAIDARKRVVHDVEDDRYVVVDGRTWYCYRPDGDS